MMLGPTRPAMVSSGLSVARGAFKEFHRRAGAFLAELRSVIELLDLASPQLKFQQEY